MGGTNEGGTNEIELPEQLREWIGRESPPLRAPGPIEWSEVRRYMNVTGDMNPLWGAANVEQNPHRDGALIPPAMVLDVLRPAPGSDVTAETGDRDFPSVAGLASMVSAPGENARMNVGTEIEWIRPPRIGDWITVRLKIADIVLKQKNSDRSLFITEERKYFDQQQMLIAIVRQVTVRRLTGP